MRETTLRDHLTIVDLLPDYVLGKLDETSLRRVARHLEVCAVCRDECANAMHVLGTLADVPPPPACVRRGLMQRVADSGVSIVRYGVTPPAASSRHKGARAVALRPVARGTWWRGKSFVTLIPRWAWGAAAAILLVMGTLGWFDYQGRTGISDDRIQALIGDRAAAYPLDDSDVGLSATGVVFGEPKGRDVYLVANGLPVLPQDKRYQVWLFTTQDTLVSAGLLETGSDGEVRALLQTPDPFADYVGVALTAEPAAGSNAPTSDLVLGGSLPPLSAAVPGLPAQLMPIPTIK